jgi:hypothetical protein
LYQVYRMIALQFYMSHFPLIYWRYLLCKDRPSSHNHTSENNKCFTPNLDQWFVV